MIYLLIRLDQPVSGLTESSRTLVGYSQSTDDVALAASEAEKKFSVNCYIGWNSVTYPQFVIQELQALPIATKPVSVSRVPDSNYEYDIDAEEEEKEILWPS